MALPFRYVGVLLFAIGTVFSANAQEIHATCEALAEWDFTERVPVLGLLLVPMGLSGQALSEGIASQIPPRLRRDELSAPAFQRREHPVFLSHDATPKRTAATILLQMEVALKVVPRRGWTGLLETGSSQSVINSQLSARCSADRRRARVLAANCVGIAARQG